MAEFVFKTKDNELLVYEAWEDIPENLEFKHVIKFLPDVVEEDHTEEDHEEIAIWNERLQELMEKERASSM
jgi:hypothetical protein